MSNHRTLGIASRVEFISLIVLFSNLFTAHVKAISALMGPVHGCAYLFVVGATLRTVQADGVARVLAFVPGIGGMLALRRVSRSAPSGHTPATDPASLT